MIFASVISFIAASCYFQGNHIRTHELSMDKTMAACSFPN